MEVVVLVEVVVVVLVIEEAIVVVVVKDLVGAGGVIATLVRVVNAVSITLEFGVSASCSVDVLSDGAVDLLRDTLAGVLTVVLSGCLHGMDVDAWVDVNVFAMVMSVKFAMRAPLEGFSC